QEEGARKIDIKELPVNIQLLLRGEARTLATEAVYPEYDSGDAAAKADMLDSVKDCMIEEYLPMTLEKVGRIAQLGLKREKRIKHDLTEFPTLKRVAGLSRRETVLREDGHHLAVRYQRKIAPMMLAVAQKFTPRIFKDPEDVFDISLDEFIALFKEENPEYISLTFERIKLWEEAEKDAEEMWPDDRYSAFEAYTEKAKRIKSILNSQIDQAKLERVKNYYRALLKKIDERVEELGALKDRPPQDEGSLEGGETLDISSMAGAITAMANMIPAVPGAASDDRLSIATDGAQSFVDMLKKISPEKTYYDGINEPYWAIFGVRMMEPLIRDLASTKEVTNRYMSKIFDILDSTLHIEGLNPWAYEAIKEYLGEKESENEVSIQARRSLAAETVNSNLRQSYSRRKRSWDGPRRSHIYHREGDDVPVPDVSPGEGFFIVMEPDYPKNIRNKLELVISSFRNIEPDPHRLYLLDPELLRKALEESVDELPKKNIPPELEEDWERIHEKSHKVADREGPVIIRFYYKDIIITHTGLIYALGYVINRDLLALRHNLTSTTTMPEKIAAISVTLGQMFGSINETEEEGYRQALEELRNKKDENGQPAVLFESTVSSLDILKKDPRVGDVANERYNRSYQKLYGDQDKEEHLSSEHPFFGYLERIKLLFQSRSEDISKEKLLRIPIEALDAVGSQNIGGFLRSLQSRQNMFIELYSITGIGEVSERLYLRYGLEKQKLPEGFVATRQNTVTLFPVFKGEDLSDITVSSRMGDVNIGIKDTILAPVGIQNDPVGLIRSTFLALMLMSLVDDLENNTQTYPELKDAIQSSIMEPLKEICDPRYKKDLAGLSADDIIALASSSSVNDILKALKKLIKLIPTAPIDPEIIRRSYIISREIMLKA
ncbi:MAG: hypothetical protein HQ594_06580, partial [Candidatus Omnitrophica bacterium]|nr:hypothetical protein [Candidatus Omnitrophota bacterium]